MKIMFRAILTVEAALKAVEQEGDALQYVREQTEPVCLKAVEQNGDALRYVREQTEAVCLKAVAWGRSSVAVCQSEPMVGVKR